MGGAYSSRIPLQVFLYPISVRYLLGCFSHASGKKKKKKALCFLFGWILNPRFNWKMIGNVFL